MVGRFEREKDFVQDLAESGAQRVNGIIGIVARSVREIGHESSAGADRVSAIAGIVTGAVRDVTREIGEFITDGIEMREATKKAARDDH